jgi:fumarate reductase subunit C
VSSGVVSTGPTPTAPSRAPDGFWLGHARYRSYVLFAGTGLILALDVLILMRAARALGEGSAAWQAFLAGFAGPVGIVAAWLLFLSTLFFSIRWVRVGAKIPPLPFGLLFGLPSAVFLIGQYATLVLLSAVLLLVLSGVIL